MTELTIRINKKEYPARQSTEALTVIENLELKIKQHEFVCLFGPSGCGKTTMMNIIAGLDTVFEGSIKFGNQPAQESQVGYVFQEPRLLPWCTVQQNIELALENTLDPNQLDDLLDQLEISDIKHHFPSQISLGMARRVALARAFIIQPEILLMDEPFVSLDNTNADRIRHKLVDTWSTHPHTIVFVTHDLREAIFLADRIIMLSPAPTQIHKEITVSLSRVQRTNDALIEEFRQSMITTR
ncbi:MAG: ATP-binding cassette domain-containing protein [Gammaproteobacteria bacterium]|nr:ATP-binding cassette domain-containing protein [Gammaproteobacteria bacterium]